MVNNLAAFDHCLSGVEQNRSFFNQCGIRTLFFRLIERDMANQHRHVNRGKVRSHFETGCIPGRIGEVS